MISMKLSRRTAGARKPASVFRCDQEEEEDGADRHDKSETTTVTSAEEHKTRGCDLAEQGGEENMRSALTHFEKGVQLEPANHLLWELKSQVLLFFEKYLSAIEAAEESVRLAPSWAEGYVTLARAQREFGEIELSYASMQKAASLDDSNGDIKEELKDIEVIVQKLHVARTAYEMEKVEKKNVSDEGNSCTLHPNCEGGSSCLASNSSIPIPRCFSRMHVVSNTSPLDSKIL